MISAILTFLGGPAIGSLIGGILGYFNRRLDISLEQFKLEQRALDRQHEVAMRSLDIQLAAEEAKGKAQVAVIEGNADVESERMRSLAVAFESDKGPPDWVDKMRRSVRPVMTYVLGAGALTVNGILLWRMGDVWPDLPPAERARLIIEGVAWVGTQASVALAFWFVSRPAELTASK